MNKSCPGRLPLLVIVLLIIADQLSKWQVMVNFRLYETK